MELCMGPLEATMTFICASGVPGLCLLLLPERTLSLFRRDRCRAPDNPGLASRAATEKGDRMRGIRLSNRELAAAYRLEASRLVEAARQIERKALQ